MKVAGCISTSIGYLVSKCQTSNCSCFLKKGNICLVWSRIFQYFVIMQAIDCYCHLIFTAIIHFSFLFHNVIFVLHLEFCLLCVCGCLICQILPPPAKNIKYVNESMTELNNMISDLL